MINFSVKLPKRLQEQLYLKAQELNVNPSELARDALWQKIHELDENTVPFSGKKSKKNHLEEQVYFIRSVVESIAMVMEGGGDEFIDKCHEHKEKLLKTVR